MLSTSTTAFPHRLKSDGPNLLSLNWTPQTNWETEHSRTLDQLTGNEVECDAVDSVDPDFGLSYVDQVIITRINKKVYTKSQNTRVRF